MIPQSTFDAICEAAGLPPSTVAAVYADAAKGVTFVVYMRDADGKKFIDPNTGQVATGATWRAWSYQ